MHAVDTNIVVRYLMNDDAAQAGRARRFVDEADIFVPATVILETEWILRSVYRLSPNAVGRAIRQFIGLPTAHQEQPAAVAQALAWFEQGMDFADALHLATAQNCDGLATFDQDFIKAAARLASHRGGAVATQLARAQ